MTKSLKVHTYKINNLNVIHIPHPSQNAYIAFFAKAGSFLESKDQYGYSHFIEHMFFKGTEKRVYTDITQGAALLGALQNAYTGDVEVCYHLTLPVNNIEKGLDLLSDMYFNSTFPENEVEKEKGVVTEEIKMYDDDHSTFFSYFMSDTLLHQDYGHPVIGYKDNINKLTRDSILSFKNTYYGLNNTYVLIAGNIKEKEVKRIINKLDVPQLKSSIPEIPDNWCNLKSKTIKRKGIQQTYYALVYDGLCYKDFEPQHRVALDCLGGGMFSILFERVREQLGLCYSVYSDVFTQHDKGGLSYVFTMTDKPKEANQAILECIENTLKTGISQRIFDCAKASNLGTIARRSETSSGVISMIKDDLIFSGKVNEDKFDKMLNKYSKLSLKKVNDAFVELFDDKSPVTLLMKPE